MQLKDLGNLTETIYNLKSGTSIFGDLSLSMQRMILSSGELDESMLKNCISSLTFIKGLDGIEKTASGLSKTEVETALHTSALSASQTAATGATTGLSAAMKGLWATLKANPIILAVAAVTVGIMAFKNFKESQEEARRAAQEAAHTYDTKSCLELLDNYKSTLSSVRISLIFDSVLLA